MESILSIDLISDLNLSKGELFDWSGKATSLFCAVAGNISDDLEIIKNTLLHLGKHYRGVFYIDGSTEHLDLLDYEYRVEQIAELCRNHTNIVYLHNHVVVLNGVAYVGVNGWYHNSPNVFTFDDQEKSLELRNNDLAYLSTTIKKLQYHVDVEKIVIISASIPTEYLLFNNQIQPKENVEPGLALIMDMEFKVTHWLYGGTTIHVDNVYNNRHYVNNARVDKLTPYWPKRVLL